MARRGVNLHDLWLLLSLDDERRREVAVYVEFVVAVPAELDPGAHRAVLQHALEAVVAHAAQ